MGGGGGCQGVRNHPPLKNDLKGSNPSTKLFLESGVKFTGNALYFYQKLIFFRGACPSTPLVMVCLM